MLNRLQKSMDEKDKGFTLIELLVVIVIIGILAAIAIPLFLNQRQKGVDAGLKSDVKQLATLQETYYVDMGSYASTEAALEAEAGNFSKSDDATSITISGDANGYCVSASNTKASDTWSFDSDEGRLATGAC